MLLLQINPARPSLVRCIPMRTGNANGQCKLAMWTRNANQCELQYELVRMLASQQFTKGNVIWSDLICEWKISKRLERLMESIWQAYYHNNAVKEQYHLTERLSNGNTISSQYDQIGTPPHSNTKSHNRLRSGMGAHLSDPSQFLALGAQEAREAQRSSYSRHRK